MTLAHLIAVASVVHAFRDNAADQQIPQSVMTARALIKECERQFVENESADASTHP